MIRSKSIEVLLVSILSIMLFTGCSHKDNKQSFDEQIWQTYSDNNRLDKYNELVERYGNIRIILLLNEKKDSWTITNKALWVVFLFLPDILAIITLGLIMRAIGMKNGGSILSRLAWIGKKTGSIPGLSPAIVGILDLGVMFSVLQKLFELLF